MYHKQPLALIMLLFTSDINECETGGNNCTHFCNNTEGSYTCSCREGYDVAEYGTCVGKMREFVVICVLSLLPTTHDFVSFIVITRRCFLIDIDECYLNISGCEHYCSNTNGSYYCRCRPGFRLHTNNHSCEGKMSILFAAELYIFNRNQRVCRSP